MDDAPAQTQPPATLQVDTQFAGSALGQQLQQLLAKGRGSDAMIADFLLRNPVRATAWGIEELAEPGADLDGHFEPVCAQTGF